MCEDMDQQQKKSIAGKWISFHKNLPTLKATPTLFEVKFCVLLGIMETQVSNKLYKES